MHDQAGVDLEKTLRTEITETDSEIQRLQEHLESLRCSQIASQNVQRSAQPPETSLHMPAGARTFAPTRVVQEITAHSSLQHSPSELLRLREEVRALSARTRATHCG